MNRLIYCFTIGVVFCWNVCTFAESDETFLARSGQTDYAIVLPEKPTLVQETAASELRDWFRQATNAELPIVAENQLDAGLDLTSFQGARLLIVGSGELARRAIGDVEIGYDGIILKRVGDAVVLSGSPRRGALYAVYEFLERELGIRWLTSTETWVPKLEQVALDDELDVLYAPPFEYRESFYRDAFNSPFAARLRCNGDTERLTPEFGGKHEFLLGVHSAFYLIPPKKYFREHKDWFAEIDGRRRVGVPFAWGMEDQLEEGEMYGRGTQLCFSNDEMIEELIKNAREILRKSPDASFISISQNDCEGYCTCEKCREIDEQEGSHAGSILRAVNKVAEALEDEFPNVHFETLAYTYTRKPPKITKPRRNVVVRLCSIECSYAQPLDSENNASFRDDLLGWNSLTDKLFVWDYATDFAYYVLPFPNYRVIAPNIKFYAEHGVLGFLEQGDYHSPTGDFVELRAWIVAKLLWNPNADVDALFDDFVSKYYAPELVPIYRGYFNVLSDAVARNDFHLGIYLMTTRDWLDVPSLVRATELQNQAREIAERLERESPGRYAGLVDKVRRGRLPLDAVWAQEYRRAYIETRLTGREFPGVADPVRACRDYIDALDEFGFQKRRENEPGEMYPDFRKATIDEYADWRTPFAKKAGVCDDLPDDAWLDLQEFDLIREEGVGIEKIDDASNGYAVKFGADGKKRASWTTPEQIALLRVGEGESDSCKLYVCARLAPGASIKTGTFDPETNGERALNVVDLQRTDGEWSVLEAEGADVASGARIWIETTGGDVLVDRIILARQVL